MGGPCFIVPETHPNGRTTGQHKKTMAPPCTDNFQVLPFYYPWPAESFESEGDEPEGDEPLLYQSVEQCYQASKYVRRTKTHEKIRNLVPRVNETDSGHGMRCWSEGQRGRGGDSFSRFEDHKVSIMLEITLAKYSQHRIARAELLECVGNIVGGPSTSWKFNGTDHNWKDWNGKVQECVREELRIMAQEEAGGEANRTKLDSLRLQFERYGKE